MTILGRLYVEDERDRRYPMQTMLKEPATSEEQEILERGYRYWWADGWWGDQWYTPQCVSYAWTHWLEDGPTTHFPTAPDRKSDFEIGAMVSPQNLYDKAQRVDEWPGEDYDGTSVRAGAKILQEWGHISRYGWAWDVDTIVDAILTTGPVVVGTNWYESMSYPDTNGLITLGGDPWGGHAYLLNGVNRRKKIFRIKNSWGRQWGKDGFAYISFDDMSKLIDWYGEACLADEVPDAN